MKPVHRSDQGGAHLGNFNVCDAIEKRKRYGALRLRFRDGKKTGRLPCRVARLQMDGGEVSTATNPGFVKILYDRVTLVDRVCFAQADHIDEPTDADAGHVG